MKTITLFLAIVLAATPVAAEPKCAGLAALASIIMGMRQSDHPLADMLAIEDNPEVGNRAMVIEAYSLPRFATIENRRKAAKNFSDTVHSACMERMSK